MSTASPQQPGRDEQRLAQLGYTQELQRSWSGFHNFAISFTIISILAGCFTTYGQAWNNGGPIAISWGWLVISAFVLVVGLCLAEIVSAYPTAGGLYWWAARMGGPGWGWFTGWFNLAGLAGVVASVSYGSAQFVGTILGLYGVKIFGVDFGDEQHILAETFCLFVLILCLHATINIFSSRIVARVNGISVWWHVVGVFIILLVLVLVPSHHASVSFVFGHTINNSGFGPGMFWFFVLPLGFLLTQYTITGFDASAHISEETHEAEIAAAKGVWRSIFYSGLIGWVLLLAITFAASKSGLISENGGSSIAVLESALSSGWVKLILIISTVGQLFCGMAGLTSASRMCFAFSRDGALPGSKLWSRVHSSGVPSHAVLLMSVIALLITVPALWGNSAGFPVAFFAVVSITVIGLYIAYVIPIYLRLRAGDKFESGPWTLGGKYRWMCTFSVIWVVIITVLFSLPTTPAAVPWSDEFSFSSLNYAPLMVGGLFVIVGIWWLLSARRTFTGPKRSAEVNTILSGDAPLAPDTIP